MQKEITAAFKTYEFLKEKVTESNAFSAQRIFERIVFLAQFFVFLPQKKSNSAKNFLEKKSPMLYYCKRRLFAFSRYADLL